MKKITAFFLVLLPIFITALMFISGLIQNINFPVSVAGISITESDQDIIWDQNKEKTNQEHFQFSAHVLPLNAKNQQILWSSSNPDIAEVNDDGYVTIKAYGKVMITATAAGNQSCKASREIDSFDEIVHDITVTNKYNVDYLSIGSVARPLIETSPSIDHVVDSSMKYSAVDCDPEDCITVNSNNGMITANKAGTAKVKIEAIGKDSMGQRTSSAVQQIDVRVDDPVDVVAWENAADEVITDTTYDLYKAIRIAPAQKKTATSEFILPTDFEYKTSNKDVAEVDEKGIITFHKANEDVTFDVTYKRNTDLKISKKIQTTANNFKHIYFQQNSIELDCQPGKNIPQDKLSWITYPEKAEFSNVQITSSDEDVVLPSGVNDTAATMVAPGKCALRIESEIDGQLVTDVCEVTLKPTNIIKCNDGETITTDIKTPYYYPLVNNINIASSSLGLYEISFSMPNNEVAYIDDNNILHFKQAGETPLITASLNGQTATFKVKSSDVQGEILEAKDTSVIVGKNIKFKNVEPKFDGKYYQDHFDVFADGSFVAKRGCDISDFEFNDGKKIRLIVQEDPIYVKADQGPIYSTAEEQVDFLNTYNPQIYPSTALKADGTVFEPIYEYEKSNSWILDENVINFSGIGTCKVTVNYGKIHEEDMADFTSSYFVRSTFHDNVGKFTVTTNELLPISRTTKNQYDKWEVGDTLRIDGVAHRYYESLQIKSLNGLCNPTLDWVGLLLTGHIELNANPISGAYGDDIIEISSPTYSLFLKVHLDAKITDFVVTYNGDIWDDTPRTSYISTLSKVRVTPNTAGLESSGAQHDWTWSFDGVEQKNGSGSEQIDLDLGDAEKEHILHLYVDGNEIKQYIINRKIASAKTMKVELYGCENGIYASYNSNQKSAVIVPDGYVDKAFYENFKQSSLQNTVGESVSIDGNVITISNFPTKDAATYSNKFDLKFGKKDEEAKIIKTYDVGKDYVSKIKLPKHNIYDESDKKGMQKVHVYGNYSYYPGIGEVNYYKVPVELYDNKRKLVTDKQLKLLLLNNLNISIGRNSGYEIDESGDFIKVFFNKNDLYTPEEIYNDAFDTKTGKNIDFRVATKSNEVSAEYKFVAVEGTNVWNQEAILKNSRRELKAMGLVLQKHFGISDHETQDSAVLNDTNIKNYWSIYGNGYCINTDYLCQNLLSKSEALFGPSIYNCFNVDLNGLNSDLLTSRKFKVYLSFNTDDEKEYESARYVKYSSIHHFTYAFKDTKTNYPGKIKNCVLHSNMDSCLYLDGTSFGKSPKIYLEDCSFFNSASFPISTISECPVYLKGRIDIYNFQNEQMLRNVCGKVDLTNLWPLVLSFARSAHMVHKDAVNNEVINSFMIAALNQEIYFWDISTNQYIKSDRGISGAAKYLAKYCDISVPIPLIGRVGANLWGGTNPSFEPGAPSYFDEYDSNGKLKMTFLSSQVIKLTRHPKYF